jgi:hypothetical protein
MMPVMVKDADLDPIVVPEDFEVSDATALGRRLGFKRNTVLAYLSQLRQMYSGVAKKTAAAAVTSPQARCGTTSEVQLPRPHVVGSVIPSAVAGTSLLAIAARPSTTPARGTDTSPSSGRMRP